MHKKRIIKKDIDHQNIGGKLLWKSWLFGLYYR